MKLVTASKIKLIIAKDINRNLKIYSKFLLNEQGKKLSNPLSWKLFKVK